MTKMYQCNKCKKMFNLKGNYSQHLNRKKSCIQINSFQITIQQPEITNLQCMSCQKSFSSKYCKDRHEKESNCVFKLKLQENPLQCYGCLQQFSTKTNRVRHEKNNQCAFKEKHQYTESQVIQVLTQQNKKMDDKFTDFMENQLKHNTESKVLYPINNQLINLIVDKTNTIGELKSIINSKEVNPEIPIHELTELIEKMQKELDLKDQKIKLLEDAYIKKQQRKDYPEKNVIYMLTTEDHKNKRIYIIGKARDLKNRLSGYNKTSEHEVVYYKECKSEDDMNIIEVMVLNKLKEYKEKANRDRFVLPIENDIIFFTNIIDLCVNFYT